MAEGNNSGGPPPTPPPGMEPKEIASIHIIMFDNGQVGVSYPKNLKQAFFLLGEGTKILGQELIRQLGPGEDSRIVVPKMFTTKGLKGGS